MVTDSYDAYRIFETVNATGVDLSVADLIKNMVFRHIREDELTEKTQHKSSGLR